jgi:hypothetical protein
MKSLLLRRSELGERTRGEPFVHLPTALRPGRKVGLKILLMRTHSILN